MCMTRVEGSAVTEKPSERTGDPEPVVREVGGPPVQALKLGPEGMGREAVQARRYELERTVLEVQVQVPVQALEPMEAENPASREPSLSHRGYLE